MTTEKLKLNLNLTFTDATLLREAVVAHERELREVGMNMSADRMNSIRSHIEDYLMNIHEIMEHRGEVEPAGGWER